MSDQPESPPDPPPLGGERHSPVSDSALEVPPGSLTPTGVSALVATVKEVETATPEPVTRTIVGPELTPSSPRSSRGMRRVLRGAAGGALAALAAALYEAFQVHSASPAADLLRTWLACAGLSAPLGVLLGAATGFASVLLHPDASPAPRSLANWLSPLDPRRRARLSVILAVTPLLVVLWLLVESRTALRLLSHEAPAGVIGFALVLATVGLTFVLSSLVLGLARYVGVRLRSRPPSPVLWGGIGLAAGLLAFTLLVALGPTAGVGFWGVLGVFRRPELDLRVPALLGLVVLCAYGAGAAMRKIPLAIVAALALVPLALTQRSAGRGLASRAVALGVERDAPLSRICLRLARRVTDRDQDGFSAAFGGGDCDEGAAARNPGAEDLPGNGIDEDCSGADSRAVTDSARGGGQATVAEARDALPKQLNLVLLTIDTVRAELLGTARNVMPNLARLASRGVRFDAAYSPASYTGKSVGPFLIGKHSSETNRDYSHFNAFSKDLFVQERLHSAGVRTISVQGYWYFYQSRYGFHRGFDVVDSSASPSAGYSEGDRSSNSAALADALIAQLARPENTAGRFYLWSHFTDPHAEYVPHPGFERGDEPRSRYEGEVAYVDHAIGRIIDAIEKSPMAKRTAIVVTSDHGEAFGEHHMIRHGFELWEPLVRVPLVVYVPGLKPQEVKVRRSLIDLVPTLLDLMAAPAPGGEGVDFVSGQSLVPDLVGLTAQARPLLIDMAEGPFNAERQAYIDGPLKVIASNGRALGVYDLDQDPAEANDLLEHGPEASLAVERFKAYRRSLKVVRVRKPD